MTEIAAEASAYIEAFRADAHGGPEPRWLVARREAALARFGELGFPTRRQEAWRFTDLRPLQHRSFPPAGAGGTVAPPTLVPYALDEPSHRLVLVNGRIAPELSAPGELPPGVWLASTGRTLAERPALLEPAIEESDTVGAQPFASLNAAFFADGFVLAVDAGVTVARPIEIVHFGRTDLPQSFHLRSLISLGAGSRARVIESFAGEGVYWTNAVTAIELGQGATLDHAKLQDEGREAIHFAVARTRLGKAARYRSFVLTLGARLSRQDLLARFAEEGGELGLSGAYLLRGDQEATNATFVDHAAHRGTTREVFKGVIEDRAHGVFLGSIGVRPQAQKTDAQQVNKNLLLSPRATVDTKPELEILADDVKCSHGATVGELDETALFYLRSRGIPEADARRLLIEAFAADAIDGVADQVLREYLMAHLRRWLGRRGERA